jgi:hypothetical protein
MCLLKNKQQGYVLLLTMIIVSSIFLLVISVVVKNRLINSTAKTISLKHEQNILFMSGVSIVKALLSLDELNKNNKNTKNEILPDNKDTQTEKHNTKKDEKKLPLLFFNFYWNKCNKWLKYKFINNKFNLDGTISIYLSIEDGKFPLKKLYAEYEKQIKKETENEPNQNNTESKENKNKTDKDDIKKETDLEKEMQKNQFLEKIKKIFIDREEKSNLFKKIISNKKKEGKGDLNKNSLIMTIINNHFKTGGKQTPSLFQDAFNDQSLNNEDLYGNKNTTDVYKKEYGIQDVFSLSNNSSSLWYIAPALIEFLDKKPLTLHEDIRKKIIDSGKTYFEKTNTGDIKTDDLWNALYAGAFNIPYQKEFFDMDGTQKIFTTDIDLPHCFSALIKIEILNTVLFGLVFFEKNKKYVKSNENNNSQNQEYLIKSIYILPFE